MLGPVFTLELARERRRGRSWQLLGWAYAGFLALQVLLVWGDTAPRVGPGAVPMILRPHRTRQLIAQHFFVLFLLTPALTASALGDEKANGTLAHLFTTPLTSAEILGGKLAARSLRVVGVMLPSLPVLFLVGGYAEVPLRFFAALLLVSLLVVLGLSAVGLLCAVECKRSSAAVLAAYALIGVGGLAAHSAFSPALNPLEMLAVVAAEPDPGVLALALGKATCAWVVVTGFCFVAALWRLRPDGLRQMHGGEAPRRAATAAARPPVEDDPIRWKEYHLEGLAVLPGLRRLPRAAGVVAVLGVSGLVSACSARESVSAAPSEPDPYPFIIQGLLFLLASTLVVTVRAAGAVSGERERHTWESLRLTPLDGRTFLHGKLRGICDAVLPYFAAYSVPAFLLSLAGGPFGLLATIASLLLAWPLLYYAAACGLRTSVEARSTWRALVAALFLVCFMGPCLSLAVSFGAGCFCGFVGLFLNSLAASRDAGAMMLGAALITIPIPAALVLVWIGRSSLRHAEARALAPPDEVPPTAPVRRATRKAAGVEG